MSRVPNRAWADAPIFWGLSLGMRTMWIQKKKQTQLLSRGQSDFKNTKTWGRNRLRTEGSKVVSRPSLLLRSSFIPTNCKKGSLVYTDEQSLRYSCICSSCHCGSFASSRQSLFQSLRRAPSSIFSKRCRLSLNALLMAEPATCILSFNSLSAFSASPASLWTGRGFRWGWLTR